MESILVRKRVSVPYAMVLTGLLGLAMVLEMAFASAIRLPGHRAFPGAFAILLLAEVLVPVTLVVLTIAASTALVMMGYASVPVIAAWAALAVVLVLVRRKEFARSMACFILMGLLFGLFRYLALSFGIHKTPEMIRLVGHLAFGGVGGLGAWVATRCTRAMGEDL